MANKPYKHKETEKTKYISLPENKRAIRKRLLPREKQKQLERTKIQIAERLRLGWSDRMIKDWLSDEYEVCAATASKWLKAAYEYLSEGTSVFKEHIREKQQERFEYILTEAIKASKWDVANRILDNMNKMFNLYDNSTKIEVTGDVVQFKFGDVQENNEGEDMVVDGEIIEEA